MADVLEEVAKTKSCPFAMSSSGGPIFKLGPVSNISDMSSGSGPHILCRAIRCMAWKYTGQTDKLEPFGRCKLIPEEQS